MRTMIVTLLALFALASPAQAQTIVRADQFVFGTTGALTTKVRLLTGAGSPEGAAGTVAPVGSVYIQTDGVSGTTLWSKTSGTGNTGWTIPFLVTSSIDTCAKFAAIMTGETGTCGAVPLSDSPDFTTRIRTPAIQTASGALTVTPAAGSGVAVNLSTTGDFCVNTDDLCVDTSAGNVGIGDTSPAALFTVGNGDLFQVNSSGVIAATGNGTHAFTGTVHASTRLVGGSTDGIVGAPQLYLATNSDVQARISRASANNEGPAIIYQKARGTLASPATVSSGDTVGTFSFEAADGSGTVTYRERAAFGVEVDGTPSGSSVPMRMVFKTGSTAATERWRIDSSGNLLGNSATQIIGMNTIDTADNLELVLQGGGGDASGRGATLKFAGNEHANLGRAFIATGAIGGANIQFRSSTAGLDALILSGDNGSSTFATNRGTTAGGMQIVNSHATTPHGIFVNYSAAAPNDTNNFFFRGTDTGGDRFQLRANGGLANFSANNVNLSDARTKTIFGPAPRQREQFRMLQFVTARYIDAPTSTPDVMVTAQQVGDVYPELLAEFESGKLGVREHGLTMRAMQVIQELDADDMLDDERVAVLQKRVDEQAQTIDLLLRRLAAIEAALPQIGAKP